MSKERRQHRFTQRNELVPVTGFKVLQNSLFLPPQFTANKFFAKAIQFDPDEVLYQALSGSIDRMFACGAKRSFGC